MHNIWILTEEYNEYDQHGGYFLAAFTREPTEEDLKSFGHDHFNRVNDEYCWVNKELVKCLS